MCFTSFICYTSMEMLIFVAAGLIDYLSYECSETIELIKLVAEHPEGTSMISD